MIAVHQLRLLCYQLRSSYQPVNINDYHEELVVMLSSARKMVAKANQEAQRCYKHQYDKSLTSPKYQIDDWVFVYFPSEETGILRKLSQPWHGPLPNNFQR